MMLLAGASWSGFYWSGVVLIHHSPSSFVVTTPKMASRRLKTSCILPNQIQRSSLLLCGSRLKLCNDLRRHTISIYGSIPQKSGPLHPRGKGVEFKPVEHSEISTSGLYSQPYSLTALQEAAGRLFSLLHARSFLFSIERLQGEHCEQIYEQIWRPLRPAP